MKRVLEIAGIGAVALAVMGLVWLFNGDDGRENRINSS